MITGGQPSNDVGQLAELLSPNGTSICEVESLPDKRYAHTQNGLISCGGCYTENNTCLIFAGGSWKRHGTTLLHRRSHHSSWTRGGHVMLIGGSGSMSTTETISIANGRHQASFDLKHPTRYKIPFLFQPIILTFS